MIRVGKGSATAGLGWMVVGAKDGHRTALLWSLVGKGQAPVADSSKSCGGAKSLRMEGGWCQRCGIVTHVLCVSLETLDVRSEPAQGSSSGRGRGLAGFGTIAIASAPFRPDWLWRPRPCRLGVCG